MVGQSLRLEWSLHCCVIFLRRQPYSSVFISTQMHKWVLTKKMELAFHPGRSSNTPSHFMLGIL